MQVVVETTSRLAQWRVDLSFRFRQLSDSFEIGTCWWCLEAEDSNGALLIALYTDSTLEDCHLLASFKIRVLHFAGELKALLHQQEVTDEVFERNGDPFVWQTELPYSGKIIIDCEFLEIKVIMSNDKKSFSVWGLRSVDRYCSEEGAVISSVGRMLTDSILADIEIRTSDGRTLQCHRAILASRSPVFKSMFSHNLKEKRLSAVYLPDMSSESCAAFLAYLYGTISKYDFRRHRVALLRAADKYDVPDLKKECQKGLLENLEDIDMKNVLERYEMAKLYGLEDLKRECMKYLVRFGKICDAKDDLRGFFDGVEREVILEVFVEVLEAWKGF